MDAFRAARLQPARAHGSRGGTRRRPRAQCDRVWRRLLRAARRHAEAGRMTARHVAIDVKNLALYTGGIAAHSRILITGWLAARPELRFSLVGPAFDSAFLKGLANWRHVPVSWPTWLPRPLRHPYYDNRLFPAAIAKLGPDVMFTPYHDVRLPRRATGVRSVMMLHDTCLQDLPD